MISSWVAASRNFTKGKLIDKIVESKKTKNVVKGFIFHKPNCVTTLKKLLKYYIFSSWS